MGIDDILKMAQYSSRELDFMFTMARDKITEYNPNANKQFWLEFIDLEQEHYDAGDNMTETENVVGFLLSCCLHPLKAVIGIPYYMKHVGGREYLQDMKRRIQSV